MEEPSNRSAVAYIKSKENYLSDRLGIPDKDDVIRLTRGMKRENWQPRPNVTPFDLVREWLGTFDSVTCRDVARFGITPVTLQMWGKRGLLNGEYVTAGQGETLTVYTLPEWVQ